MYNPGVAATLGTLWRQSSGLFKIYIQDGLAYKASGVIWILTDVTTAITMPLVWLSSATTGTFSGYSQHEIVLYYLSIILLTGFVVCHFMWDISFEIKEGVFSSQLIRPVSYLHFILVRNLAWRCVRTAIFLPFFGVILWFYSSSIAHVQLNLSWEFWVSVILGHFVSVMFVTALAMIALFTQEAQSIFELYYVPMLFLSGQLFPLALMPDWVKSLAKVMPFYYTTGAPTEILIGRTKPADAPAVIGIQALWIVVSFFLFKFLWKRGTRTYTGVGM